MGVGPGSFLNSPNLTYLALIYEFNASGFLKKLLGVKSGFEVIKNFL